MTVDFKALKKGNSLDKLRGAVEALAKPKYAKDDERFWQPELDKAGNGYAIIRLLDAPAADGEDGLPWVQLFTHGFQGPGGWYIENCPTTLQGKCPACEHNNKLWNSGIEANKKIASAQKRKLVYISNVLVVSDPKHPENEGKVFLWRYGKKIFDKVQEKLTPAFADETAINVYDFWKGANLKLKIVKVAGFNNYDKSEFEAPSPVLDDDKKIEALWKSAHSLRQFVSPTEFKGYDELNERLAKTLGGAAQRAASAPRIADDSAPWDEPKASAPRKTAESLDNVDEDLEYFNALANE